MTIFRAYDVRGVYGTDLTEDITARIGSAFGSYLQGGVISLGRDTRVSGPSLEKAFLQGALATGCQVESYGVLPISILSYVTLKERRSAAAYISASHNPPEYNGVRFRTGDGYGLLYHQTPMMDIYRSGRFSSGEGRHNVHKADEAVDAYTNFVSEKVVLDRRLKVVLDMGNGSACVMGFLYSKMGFEAEILNGSMDGRFPGRGPSPGEGSMRDASKVVVSGKADFGIGFDPDADRGIVIDDTGRFVPPEKVAIILAKERYSPGDIIISGFDCSMILERELESAGFKVFRERVGDVYVANRVKSSGAVLGVERSGHFFLPEFQYSDDPFAMSLALAEVLCEGEPLSKLAGRIPDLPYRQVSIPCSRSTTLVMDLLLQNLSSFEPDTTDGIKITTEDYSVLIRPSNTEPLLRLYVETAGDDPTEIQSRFQSLILEAINGKGAYG